MRTSRILVAIFISIFIQLADFNICNGQSGFWDNLLDIFKKEEPVSEISGKNEIEKGGTLKIQWNIEEADRVDIKGIKKNVSPSGSIQVQPDSTRYYIFSIHRNGEVNREYFRVKVYQPEIAYFHVPEKATDEEKVTIRWKVENADTISIPGIADNLEKAGRINTRLKDSVIRLIAKGKYNTATKEARVDISYIEDFEGTEELYKGHTGKLRWKYKQTKYVKIKGKDDEFSPIDTVSVQPEKTKSYEIYAYRKDGIIDTVNHEIKVVPAEILYFRGPAEVKQDQQFTVSWKAANVDSAWLSDMKVPARGYKNFKISDDTSFTLTIRKGNTTKRKSLKVQVLPPRAFVNQIDTDNSYRGTDIDILSVDQSKFPDQIKMRVLVVDTIGNFVHSLAPPYASKEKAKKYFRSLVEEANGKTHNHDNFKIREIRKDTAQSFNISMVLDHSGSMYSLIDDVHRSARKFIDHKFRDDQINVVKFDDSIKSMMPLESDKKRIYDSLEFNGLGNFGGSTALFAGTDEGIVNLKEQLPNKVVLLFTDGYENASFYYVGKRAYTAKQIARKVRNKEITLFIISYGDAVNKKVLEKLAMLSGGKHYNIQRQSSINKVFMELPRIFRYYYEITLNPLDDLGKHEFKLTFNNLKGAVAKTKKTIFTGNDYSFNENMSVPIYFLTELPVRKEILSNPQVLAMFDFDKHKLKMKYFPVVNKYIEYLIKHPDAKILLAGHTDSKGSRAYCKELSVERAQAVKKYIVQSGIEASRIQVRGYGKSHLKWENDEEEEKARENRRVEALIYKN